MQAFYNRHPCLHHTLVKPKCNRIGTNLSSIKYMALQILAFHCNCKTSNEENLQIESTSIDPSDIAGCQRHFYKMFSIQL